MQTYQICLPENLGRHCRDRIASRLNEFKGQASHSFKQPTVQSQSVYTCGSVTQDRLRWGFTVKRNMRPPPSRDQEQGGELDSQKETRLSFASPGEIKSREVVLDPQESPGEIKNKGWSWAQKVGLTFCFSCFSTAVLRTLSL